MPISTHTSEFIFRNTLLILKIVFVRGAKKKLKISQYIIVKCKQQLLDVNIVESESYFGENFDAFAPTLSLRFLRAYLEFLQTL